jgi:hypothetical protein
MHRKGREHVCQHFKIAYTPQFVRRVSTTNPFGRAWEIQMV